MNKSVVLSVIKVLFFSGAIMLFGTTVTIAQSNDSQESQKQYEDESPDRNLTGFEALNEAQPLWEFGLGGGAVNVHNTFSGTHFPTHPSMGDLT